MFHLISPSSSFFHLLSVGAPGDGTDRGETSTLLFALERSQPNRIYLIKAYDSSVKDVTGGKRRSAHTWRITRVRFLWWKNRRGTGFYCESIISQFNPRHLTGNISFISWMERWNDRSEVKCGRVTISLFMFSKCLRDAEDRSKWRLNAGSRLLTA